MELDPCYLENVLGHRVLVLREELKIAFTLFLEGMNEM